MESQHSFMVNEEITHIFNDINLVEILYKYYVDIALMITNFIRKFGPNVGKINIKEKNITDKILNNCSGFSDNSYLQLSSDNYMTEWNKICINAMYKKTTTEILPKMIDSYIFPTIDVEVKFVYLQRTHYFYTDIYGVENIYKAKTKSGFKLMYVVIEGHIFKLETCYVQMFNDLEYLP